MGVEDLRMAKHVVMRGNQWAHDVDAGQALCGCASASKPGLAPSAVGNERRRPARVVTRLNRQGERDSRSREVLAVIGVAGVTTSRHL